MIVYCLESLARPGTTYIGVTNNLRRRLGQHNGAGGGAKFTRAHRPWGILFTVNGQFNRSQAMSLEWTLKHKRSHIKGIPGKIATLERAIRGIHAVVVQTKLGEEEYKGKLKLGDEIERKYNVTHFVV